MAVVNASILYKLVNPIEKTTLLQFKRFIAIIYMKLRYGMKCSRRTEPSTTEIDSRHDGINHLIEAKPQQHRCQFKSCSSRRRTFCSKCNITLCV